MTGVSSAVQAALRFKAGFRYANGASVWHRRIYRKPLHPDLKTDDMISKRSFIAAIKRLWVSTARGRSGLSITATTARHRTQSRQAEGPDCRFKSETLIAPIDAWLRDLVCRRQAVKNSIAMLDCEALFSAASDQAGRCDGSPSTSIAKDIRFSDSLRSDRVTACGIDRPLTLIVGSVLTGSMEATAQLHALMKNCKWRQTEREMALFSASKRP